MTKNKSSAHVRFYGGVQDDSGLWMQRAWSEEESYSYGRRLAYIMIEGMSQRCVDIDEFYQAFQDECGYYKETHRRWKVDKSRIRGVFSVIYGIIRDYNFDEEKAPETYERSGGEDS